MSMAKEKVLRIARKNGIEAKEEPLEFNESGLDFLVVFVEDVKGERWVLRFPRRGDVIPSTAKEKRTLELVGSYILVQTPDWLVYNEELIAYKKLDGVPAGTIDHEAKAYKWELDVNDLPEKYIESLAKAMVSLHKIGKDEAEGAKLPVESAETARASMMLRMEKVKEKFEVHDALWKRWQTWVHDSSMWPKQTGLVHGDLHPGHILIDEDSRVTGFIDWTEASVTDIANDFVGHYRTFGKKELERLIGCYSAAGGYVWPNMAKHVMELEAAYPVAIAEFALKSGLEEYMEMAKQILSQENL